MKKMIPVIIAILLTRGKSLVCRSEQQFLLSPIRIKNLIEVSLYRIQVKVNYSSIQELEKGETVELLEEMDTWSRVKTADSMIGYVENKRLENLNTEVAQCSSYPMMIT